MDVCPQAPGPVLWVFQGHSCELAAVGSKDREGLHVGEGRGVLIVNVVDGVGSGPSGAAHCRPAHLL